jgi:hypothetical protein
MCTVYAYCMYHIHTVYCIIKYSMYICTVCMYTVYSMSVYVQYVCIDIVCMYIYVLLYVVCVHMYVSYHNHIMYFLLS